MLNFKKEKVNIDDKIKLRTDLFYDVAGKYVEHLKAEILSFKNY